MKQMDASVNKVVVSEALFWVLCIPYTARGRLRSLAEDGICQPWWQRRHSSTILFSRKPMVS